MPDNDRAGVCSGPSRRWLKQGDVVGGLRSNTKPDWSEPVYFESQDAVEKSTGKHISVHILIVSRELGRRISDYVRRMGLSTYYRQNLQKTSSNTYTVNFTLRQYSGTENLWIVGEGKYGFAKQDAKAIERLNRDTPTLTDLYFWVCRKYRSDIQRMRYTFGEPREETVEVVEAPSPPVDPALYELLKQARAKVAKEAGLPPYVVFHDHTLREMASHHPKSLEELGSISGIGERKRAAYGSKFLAVLLDYNAAPPTV